MLLGACFLLQWLHRWVVLVVLEEMHGPASVVSVRLLVHLLVQRLWPVLVLGLPKL